MVLNSFLVSSFPNRSVTYAIKYYDDEIGCKKCKKLHTPLHTSRSLTFDEEMTLHLFISEEGIH